MESMHYSALLSNLATKSLCNHCFYFLHLRYDARLVVLSFDKNYLKFSVLTLDYIFFYCYKCLKMTRRENTLFEEGSWGAGTVTL